MGVQFKNNAESTLADAIGTSDLGITVASGEGADFPTLGVGDYFYLTLQDTAGLYEVVKVTARTSDDMTIVRAQEGTNAAAFAAGSLCELRVTAQGIVDASTDPTLSDGSIELVKLENVPPQTLIGRDAVSTGQVEQVTIDEALDWVTSTQGAIPYRGSATWTGLDPASGANLLSSTGGNPVWEPGVPVTAGDKGDITVSGGGNTWTINAGEVSLANLANLSQYQLIGRSSSGSGVPQAVSTSSAIYTFLGSATALAARNNLSLGNIATQQSSAVAITGGTVAGLTELQGTMKLAANTSGTLALADADCFIPLTGNITLNGGVFTARQAIVLYAGAASRTVTEGASMTLRLGGSATTGSRTLAARTLAVAVVIGTNEIVITGNGVT